MIKHNLKSNGDNKKRIQRVQISTLYLVYIAEDWRVPRP
jgi:hypothetical protein